jgi:FSR family fosmidomycin resistance protein-like MFS transporter
MVNQFYKRWISNLKGMSGGIGFLTLVILLVEFFDEFHYAINGAALPVLRSELALSYTQVGLLLGLPSVTSTLIEPAIMLLGDTRLRKGLVVGGGLAITAALILLASASAFPTLLLAFIIAFPASGAFVSLSQATLMDLSHGREAQMMARWAVFGSTGNLVGPLLLAAGLGLSLGWRWAYVLLAVLAIGLVTAVWRSSFPAQVSDQVAAGEKAQPTPGELLRNLWETLKNPGLMRWIVLLQFSDLLLDVFVGYVTVYFTDVVGFSVAHAGLVLSGLMVSSLLADLALIPLLERVPGRRLVRTSAWIAIVVFSAWLLLPWPVVKVVLAIGIRFSTIGWYQVLSGEAYACAQGKTGTVMAIGSLSGLAGGGMAWLVGWVAGRAGLPAAMWLLLAGPVSLALLVPDGNALRRSERGAQNSLSS